MNKLFTVLIAFLALLGGAFAEGYGQTAPYGQYGLYSNGGSWAFPSVNSSPFEQGAEYTIRNSYVVDAEFPEELLVGAGVGYGNPEAGFGNRYAYDDYAYGNYAYDDYAFPPYGGEAYGQPAYGQPVDGYGYGYAPDAMDSMDYYPRDRTIESLGNGYVSRAYNAGGKINLPEQSYNNRVFSAPLYSEIGLVLYENGQGFTVQEGETMFKNVFIKNESLEPFYVDEVQVNEGSQAVNVQVLGSLSVVLPGTQGSVKLVLESLSVEADEVVEASFTVMGHYPSLQPQAVGPKAFLVYVNAAEEAKPLPPVLPAKAEEARPARTAETRPAAALPVEAVEARRVVASDVEVLNYTEAVRVIDQAEVKVTLKNNAASAKKVFVDVPSDQVDVRGRDVELAAGETKTLSLEALPLGKGEGVFNAALVVSVDGVSTRNPVAFQVEKPVLTGTLPGAAEALVNDGVTALASLGSNAWAVGLLVLLIVAAVLLLKDRLQVEAPSAQEQVWMSYSPPSNR